MEFDQQTVVITGASRGIGAATARYFAECGATVVLAARTATAINKLAATLQNLGHKAFAVPCDVSDPEAVQRVVRMALRETGRLDVLVNNAGLIDPIARLADSDPAAWGAVADVNLKGVYHGLRFAIPEMARLGGGTVINISSGAATSALEGWSHYCASKAGVLALTRVADKEYRDQGLRVIGLSPGTVATEMQVQIKDSGLNPVSQLSLTDHIPPEWVARTIGYLAGAGGDAHLGTDFSIKSQEGRAAVGLVPA